MRGELGRASEPGRWQAGPRRWGRGAWPGWASSSETRAGRGARARAGLERAAHGVGLAGLARLAVGRRGASRGMLLRACAELQGPGVRRGVREGQAAAWAGGTRLERPRRGSAEADRAGPRAWAVGLVFWFDFLFWDGLSLDMGFLFFFSSSISISKSNQTI